MQSLAGNQNSISFDEVENACQKIFGGVWLTNRGIEFARKCWEIFNEYEITSYKNEIGRSIILIRLIALGEIYREFNGIAFDEYIEPDYDEWTDVLEISKFRIGQIIGNNSDYSDDEEYADYINAIAYLSDQNRNTVYDILIKGFKNKDHLFYELYKTGLPDEEINENDEEEVDDSYKTPDIQDVLNDTDITSGKFEAYSWVSDGCYPYY